MTTKRYTTPYCEFLKVETVAESLQERYHVRLGPQVFSTDDLLTDIRLECENGSITVTAKYLSDKPHIRRNLQQEVNRQQRKEDLNTLQSCNNTQAAKRRAYKNKSFGSRI